MTVLRLEKTKKLKKYRKLGYWASEINFHFIMKRALSIKITSWEVLAICVPEISLFE